MAERERFERAAPASARFTQGLQNAESFRRTDATKAFAVSGLRAFSGL